MKLFVYKTLFIFFCFIIAYKFTFGSLLNQFETRLKNFASKQNISMTKKKIKEELNSAIEKDRILKLYASKQLLTRFKHNSISIRIEKNPSGKT